MNVMLVRDLDTATEASACNRFFNLLMKPDVDLRVYHFGFVKLQLPVA